MTLAEWLLHLSENEARIKTYHLGHDGSDGESDCVGLLIGAQRLAGVPYKGIHGSNYYARNCVTNLHAVTKASQLKIGQAVFKAIDEGGSGWNLSPRYDKSPDRHDYCHIGYVKSVNPLRISHCSSGGMHYDSNLGRWRFAADPKCVDFSTGANDTVNVVVKIMEKRVAPANGGTVNFRKQQSATSEYMGKIPYGTVLKVLSEENGWSQVEWDGKIGYVMSKFLVSDDHTNINSEILLPLERSVAVALFNGLKTALSE